MILTALSRLYLVSNSGITEMNLQDLCQAIKCGSKFSDFDITTTELEAESYMEKRRAIRAMQDIMSRMSVGSAIETVEYVKRNKHLMHSVDTVSSC